MADDPTVFTTECERDLGTGTVLVTKGPADGWSFPAGSEQGHRASVAAALEADRGGAG
jgi:hypothetical protein